MIAAVAICLLQAAVPSVGGDNAASAPPDIEVRASVTMRELHISTGEARMEVRAEPERQSDVVVTRSQPHNGSGKYRNLRIDIEGAATLAPPADPIEPAPVIKAEPVLRR